MALICHCQSQWAAGFVQPGTYTPQPAPAAAVLLRQQRPQSHPPRLHTGEGDGSGTPGGAGALSGFQLSLWGSQQLVQGSPHISPPGTPAAVLGTPTAPCGATQETVLREMPAAKGPVPALRGTCAPGGGAIISKVSSRPLLIHCFMACSPED